MAGAQERVRQCVDRGHEREIACNVLTTYRRMVGYLATNVV